MFKWAKALIYALLHLWGLLPRILFRKMFKRVEQCSRDFYVSFNGSLKKSNKLENSRLYKSKLYSGG